MNKKFLIFCILTTFLFSACETVIKVDLPEYTQKLVINGFFSPDETWQIRIGHSQSILDINELGVIDNAKVKILYGEKEIELRYRYDLRAYINRLELPQVGNDYTILVTAPGYPDVSSRNFIPRPSQIVSYDTTNYIENEDGYKQNLIELNFTLKDDPNEENYYHLAVYENYNGSDDYTNPKWFSTDNASIISENIGDVDDVSFSGESAVFSDYLFRGKENNIKLKEIFKNPNAGLVISLTSITKEFFQYKKSFDRSSNDDEGPFSEPEPSFTNIENGLGIFAGFNTTFVEVK